MQECFASLLTRKNFKNKVGKAARTFQIDMQIPWQLYIIV